MRESVQKHVLDYFEPFEHGDSMYLGVASSKRSPTIRGKRVGQMGQVADEAATTHKEQIGSVPRRFGGSRVDYIFGWAVRQSLSARTLARELGKGATYQQTFFVVMGGFHRFRRSSDEAQGAQREHMNEEAIEKPLPEGGKQPQSLTEDYGIPLHPLDRWDICHLLQTGRITLLPSTELEDKRKSDGLAKVFVLLQTVWSIIQFIARREPAPSGSEIKRSIFKGFLQ
ncbi:SubName: Full=Uncharacterized protein {ECO:0000313/EMBL:CCA69692.1} [Serendipita indica DSM 11827]|nr:SubName: Full=Uncharacterized protein {ECO:0000313/EMBL:CCA69692.1} [Serendipita indica DSM 11827]